MGPDSLELVRRIEEEFSVYLSDEKLRKVYTVGNLYNLLLSELKPNLDCLTGKAFYRIRTALTAVLGTSRRSVRPSTFLDDLFSEKLIRQQWSAFALECGLSLPRLRHTVMWKHWMQVLSAFLSFSGTVTLIRILSRFPFFTLDNFFVFTVFFIAGLVLWGVLYTTLLKVTPFRRSVLPTLSVGELARVVLSMNSAEFADKANDGVKLTQDQVWMRLVAVFCDQMMYRREDVVPSASIFGDLGID